MLELLFELIPYILLVLLLLIPLIINPKNNNKRYFWFCTIIVTFFSAFRYGVGWDYFNYCRAIELDDWQVNRLELLMRMLAKFSHSINYPHFFILVTGVLTVGLYAYVFTKQSISPLTSMLVFVGMPFLFLSGISIIRFALAVAVVLFASMYYKKPIIYFSLIVVAFFTHRAAIIGAFVWPFLGIVKISNKLNWIIFIVGLVASFLPMMMAPIFSGIMNAFSNIGFLDESVNAANKYMEGFSSIGFSRLPYVYALINLLNLINYKELCNRNPETNVAKLISLYNIGTSIMLFLSFDAIFASRLGQLFMVFIVLLVPYYLTLKSNASYYVVITMIVSLFFLQLTISGSHVDFIGRRNCFLPYRTIFSEGALMYY